MTVFLFKRATRNTELGDVGAGQDAAQHVLFEKEVQQLYATATAARASSQVWRKHQAQCMAGDYMGRKLPA